MEWCGVGLIGSGGGWARLRDARVVDLRSTLDFGSMVGFRLYQVEDIGTRWSLMEIRNTELAPCDRRLT